MIKIEKMYHLKNQNAMTWHFVKKKSYTCIIRTLRSMYFI